MAVKKRIDIFINGNQAGNTIGDLQKKSRQLNNEIKRLAPGTEAYKNKIKELKSVNGNLDEHRRKIKGIGGSFGKLKEGMGNFTKSFLGPLGVIGLMGAVVGGISNWVSKNKVLEKSLSSLKSLTGASARDIELYNDAAIKMGKETTLSATQVVDGFKLVGSARPELLKNRNALIAVTQEAITLAEASEQELGPSTQAMVGIMNQFELANEDASRTINVLAAGSKEGAAGIAELSAATDKSGAVANAYNISIEQNVALLETLAEKNIKGAEAGTKLKNFMLTMQTIEALPPKALEQLERYGVDIKKVADDTVPFQERLLEMSKISGDATALTQVFGKENEIVGSILLNNVDKVESYTAAVTGTNTAYEQAAINTDNLDGDLKSLDSAWEGLNLTLSGSNSLLRPFIQGLSSAINFVTDMISAFKNWDELGMENVWLRIQIAVQGANSAYGRYLKHQLRVNELTSDLIVTIKDEAREVDILTTAIAQNNQLLEQANITEENAAELHAQNEEIVSELTERYPELTEEIDFQTASYEELSILQKQITANMVQQAIEAAKVAEQERLLNEIINQSMAISQIRLEVQDEGIAGALVEKAEEAMQSTKLELENLETTFTDVEDKMNGLDLNFSEDFDVNTKIIVRAQHELNKLTDALDEAKTDTEKSIIQAQIDNGQKILEKSGLLRQDQINDILHGTQEAVTDVEEGVTDVVEKQSSKQRSAIKKAADARRKELERALKELEKLKDAIAGFREEAESEALIEAQKTDLDKELVELDIQIEKKFRKEIEAAEELAKREGEIGIEAAEQLQALLLIKQEELDKSRLDIREKHIKLGAEKQLESIKKLAELELQALDVLHQLKVQKAALAVTEVNGFELRKKKEVIEEFKQAVTEQMEFEKFAKIDALKDQLVNEEISLEEFNDTKELLEIEHQERIKEIRDQAAQESKDRAVATIGEIGGLLTQGLDVISKFREAGLQRNINHNNKLKEESIAQLENEKKAGLISEEDFREKKAAIDERFQGKENELKLKAAKQEKATAIIQAGINGALAVTKAIAILGPPPSPAGIAGIIFAGLATAAEIATISAKPLPQFKYGGYNVTGAQDGKNYNANYLGKHPGGMLPNTPSLILASEQGSEYYVPNPLLSNPRVANHVRMIEAIRTKQMVEGGFSSSNQAPDQEAETTQGFDITQQTQQELLVAVNTLNAMLPNLKVQIGEKQVDDITETQQDNAAIQG